MRSAYSVRRFVILGDDTHYMAWEKRLGGLYCAVENFLEIMRA